MASQREQHRSRGGAVSRRRKPAGGEPTHRTAHATLALPDPGGARTLDELVERLQLLKIWAGSPSYDKLRTQVNEVWAASGRPAVELAGKSTVADCFRLGRRRINADLVLAIVRALHPDAGYAAQWQQALRVVSAESSAATQVRALNALPPELAEFVGRTAALELLGQVLGRRDAATPAVCAIEGMAGAGKTQLAVHAGHRLLRQQTFDHVLFANLRGFHPDPAQPPVDPAAVLDSFLRLLRVPGQRIPHDLPGRTALFRRLLAGTRTLVVLDNAADADHVGPLLPQTPGCAALVTSRRALVALHGATHLAVNVFSPEEAQQFVTRAAPDIPAGDDPNATVRIAERCGHLPLALALLAGHLRSKPGWTLTDHADWLDERHQGRRLEAGVELALDLSYEHCPADRQRLLRRLALHPGQDADAYAAAALLDTCADAARTHLDGLCRDHLLQRNARGRYCLHDLVRAYAIGKAHDEERRGERDTALNRLFDYYLTAGAAAVTALFPSGSRPESPPAGTRHPGPSLTAPPDARRWLDIERLNLLSVVEYAGAHGLARHAIRLSRTLAPYLDEDFAADAMRVHGHAHDAACRIADRAAQAQALASLGWNHLRLGQFRSAGDYLERALHLARQEEPAVQAYVLMVIGHLDRALGRCQPAAEYYQRAVHLFQRAGDRGSAARALNNLGWVEKELGRPEQAVAHFGQALRLCRRIGDHIGEARALSHLGCVETECGRYRAAVERLREALRLVRQTGALNGEAVVLANLGVVHARMGRTEVAIESLRRAMATFRETGYRINEAAASNEIAHIAHRTGRPADAVRYYTTARDLAVGIGERRELARAHAGLGRAHRTLGDKALAREHYERALALYADLGTPEADQIRARLVGEAARTYAVVSRPR